MVESSKVSEAKLVNIRKVFHDKNARLARLLPRFMYRYLEKILHQEDVNNILRAYGDKYGLEFAIALVQDFKATYEVKGADNLPPSDRRCIFASNHPLGGLDGIILLEMMSKYFKKYKMLTNDILMNIVNLAPLFVPINKHGRQGTETASTLHEAYQSDIQIITFPAGLVSRFIDNQVMDLEWKKNFISKAIQYKRDVVPVYFSERNCNFFYRFARIRKLLGIRANLEMLYLADETFKHRNDHFTVTFGKPIPYQTFDSSRTHAQWAKWVKQQVYLMAGISQIPL
jgi:putative hemolysin